MGRADAPAGAVVVEVEIDDGQAHPPSERFGEKHPRTRRGAGDEPLGDLHVRVPDQDDVDPGDLLGQQRRRVLGEGQRVAVGGGPPAGARRRAWSRTRVAGHDDDIGAGRAQPGHPARALLDDAAEPQPAVDIRLVPQGDPGIGEAEHADRDAALERDERERRERGLPAVPGHGVRTQQREVQLVLEPPEQVDAVVELVVAQRRRVVAERVHRGGHRVDAAAVDPGVAIGQGSALDGVTGVEEHDRSGPPLGADRGDEGRDLGQADVVVRGIVVLGAGVVVPVADVAVQVGRAENRHTHVSRLSRRFGRQLRWPRDRDDE